MFYDCRTNCPQIWPKNTLSWDGPYLGERSEIQWSESKLLVVDKIQRSLVVNLMEKDDKSAGGQSKSQREMPKCAWGKIKAHRKVSPPLLPEPTFHFGGRLKVLVKVQEVARENAGEMLRLATRCRQVTPRLRHRLLQMTFHFDSATNLETKPLGWNQARNRVELELESESESEPSSTPTNTSTQSTSILLFLSYFISLQTQPSSLDWTNNKLLAELPYSTASQLARQTMWPLYRTNQGKILPCYRGATCFDLE